MPGPWSWIPCPWFQESSHHRVVRGHNTVRLAVLGLPFILRCSHYLLVLEDAHV